MFKGQRQDDYRRRRRVRPRRYIPKSWIWMGGGAILVLSVVVLVYFLFFRSYNIDRSLQKLRVGLEDRYALTSDTVYYTHGESLFSLTFSDQEKWNMAVMAPDMQVAASDTQVVAYNATQLQCFDSKGTPRYTKSILGEIQEVQCGRDNVAIHIKEPAGSYRLILLDTAGTDTAFSLDKKSIVDFGYYDGDHLYVYTIDGVSVVPASQIETYGPSMSSTGRISIQQQLLQRLEFYADHLFAIGTSQVVQIGYTGERMGEKLIYGWNYVGCSGRGNGNSPSFAFVPGGAFAGQDSISTVRITEMAAKDVYIQMKPDVQEVFLNNGRLYARSERTLYAYTLGGALADTYVLPFSPDRLSATPSSRHILLTAEDGLYLLKMP